jgi:hypothetical protein
MRSMMGGGGGGGMPDMAQMQGEWARRSAKERNGARSAEWE